QRSADGVANHENLVEGDDVTGLGLELLDLDDVVGSNLVLLPARLDNGESHMSAGWFVQPVPICRALWRRGFRACPRAFEEMGPKKSAGSLEQRFQTKPAHRTDQCAGWMGLSGEKPQESRAEAQASAPGGGL